MKKLYAGATFLIFFILTVSISLAAFTEFDARTEGTKTYFTLKNENAYSSITDNVIPYSGGTQLCKRFESSYSLNFVYGIDLHGFDRGTNNANLRVRIYSDENSKPKDLLSEIKKSVSTGSYHLESIDFSPIATGKIFWACLYMESGSAYGYLDFDDVNRGTDYFFKTDGTVSSAHPYRTYTIRARVYTDSQATTTTTISATTTTSPAATASSTTTTALTGQTTTTASATIAQTTTTIAPTSFKTFEIKNEEASSTVTDNIIPPSYVAQLCKKMAAPWENAIIQFIDAKGFDRGSGEININIYDDESGKPSKNKFNSGNLPKIPSDRGYSSVNIENANISLGDKKDFWVCLSSRTNEYGFLKFDEKQKNTDFYLYPNGTLKPAHPSRTYSIRATVKISEETAAKTEITPTTTGIPTSSTLTKFQERPQGVYITGELSETYPVTDNVIPFSEDNQLCKHMSLRDDLGKIIAIRAHGFDRGQDNADLKVKIYSDNATNLGKILSEGEKKVKLGGPHWERIPILATNVGKTFWVCLSLKNSNQVGFLSFEEIAKNKDFYFSKDKKLSPVHPKRTYAINAEIVPAEIPTPVIEKIEDASEFFEDFSSSLDRWFFYGNPPPKVENGQLRGNGDGWYQSFVVSKRTFDRTKQDLAIEFSMRGGKTLRMGYGGYGTYSYINNGGLVNINEMIKYGVMLRYNESNTRAFITPGETKTEAFENDGQFHAYKIVIKKTGGADFYVDGKLKFANVGTVDKETTNYGVLLGSHDSPYWFDDVRAVGGEFKESPSTTKITTTTTMPLPPPEDINKDSDADRLSDFEEKEIYDTDPANPDTDGDGLLDGWEVNGYDADGNGVIDVDLYKMHANPLQKDLFLELDWFENLATHSHRPNRESLRLIVKAFMDHGINLHIDIGDDPEHGFKGGNIIPETLLSDCGNTLGGEVINLKKIYFDSARAKIFRYGIIGVLNSSTCGGQAFYENGAFVVNDDDELLNIEKHDEILANGIMHEFGHTLNLGHGGSKLSYEEVKKSPGGCNNMCTWDIENFKPNYLSIMNYYFQLAGGVQVKTPTGIITKLDFSNFALPDLNENSLDEADGLDIDLENNGVGIVTFYSCKNNVEGGKTFVINPVFDSIASFTDNNGDQILLREIGGRSQSILGNAVDWNCNGIIDGEKVSVNINGENALGWEYTNYGGRSILYGRSDWNKLIYKVPETASEKSDSVEHRDLPLTRIKIISEICNGKDDNSNSQIDEGCPDKDGDGVPDDIDNCPSTPNADQKDSDKNFIGDACDVKIDYQEKIRAVEERISQQQQAYNLTNFVWVAFGILILAVAALSIGYIKLHRKIEKISRKRRKRKQ